MLKLAVIGAQTLMGREMVQVLEAKEASVLPLATGPLTTEQEEGDVVLFAPVPSLLVGLDAVVLVDTPQVPSLLDGFQGKVLDMRSEPDQSLDPIPLRGGWPAGAQKLRGRAAVEQVVALLPHLVEGVGAVWGTHLRSVACLGDAGVDGLAEQSLEVLRGEDPNLDKLKYRAAFEVRPQVGRGQFVEVLVPVFHGDLLILHVQAQGGQEISPMPAPQGCRWVEAPPSSRDVAVSAELLVHLGLGEGRHQGILTLGFDPILWGVLQPLLRMFGL